MNTTSEKKARALGINHVVLEVGDLGQGPRILWCDF